MPIEDRIIRVLDQAYANGQLDNDLRRRIETVVRQALASERSRLRAEKVVAMSEEDAVRYRVISELATDWVYSARYDANVGELRIEWATEAFEPITGYSLGDLNEGVGFRNIVLEEDRALFDATGEARLEALPALHEYRIITASGQQRWLRDYRRPEMDGAQQRVVRWFGAVKDITQEKQGEEALRDAMTALEQRVGTEVARFRAVMDQARDTIFVVDPRSGALVDANQTACEELGYHREDLLRRRINDILIGKAPWQADPEGDVEAAGLSIEQLYLRRDGTPFEVEATISRQRFMGSNYIVIVARGVEEKKQMEAQLAQSDRLASVGVLAAGVAHEINNPLVYIMNNLSYVMTHLPAGYEELTSALREARSGAERVRDIVKDLKTFSRSDDERIEPVDVRQVLDSAIKVAHNEIRHRAHLVREYEHVPLVDANARLGQVFLNLVLNAAHAIGEGDVARNQITARVESDPTTHEVRVQIRDTGVGIPPERLAKIFDPFFTTKPVGVGTGLGLSICRNITESLGGKIEVESTLGLGSIFTVTLPRSEQRAARTIIPSSRPPAQSTQSLRVLVVDDDVFVARSIRRLLRPQHEVTLAVSGRQALKLIREQHFDVIFCDVMMPEMTGMELHAAVEEVAPGLSDRFVFITGGPFTPEARELFDGVTNPCIQKPFTPGDLAAVLETALSPSPPPREAAEG